MLFLKVWQCTYNFLRDLLELGCDLSHDLLQQVNIVSTTTFPYDYWQVVWRILSSTVLLLLLDFCVLNLTATGLLHPEPYHFLTSASWILLLLDFCILNLTTTWLLRPEPYYYVLDFCVLNLTTTWLMRPEPYYYLTFASWTLLLLDFCSQWIVFLLFSPIPNC